MISTTIPIQGTFDIAKGRSSLRTHIAVQRWPPTFGARAAAVLTALGELIINAGHHNMVIVRMIVIEDGNDAGVQFSCSIHLPEGEQRAFNESSDRLGRAADDVQIQDIAGNQQILASAFLNT
jgi:hypothetical protein